MKISEIFYSVQGEGLLTGMPSVFIRTSGCNLRCVWCDTPYTSWKPEGEQMTVGDILQKMETLTANSRCQHVVLTGGEPMLLAESVELTRALKERGLHVTIETAGTVDQAVHCDLMSISPKLRNSTPQKDAFWSTRHEELRIQPQVLGELIRRYDYQLKFVVSEAQDLDEIEEILGKIPAAVEQAKILLMPEGRSGEELSRRSRELAEICKRTGYRLTPRLHVYLWGDQRGV